MCIQEIILRTLLAVLFGGIVGREREINNRPAGVRTHALVCLGAAVIAMIQVELVEHAFEMVRKYPEMKSVITVNSGRVVAQVVSGIGFLGAGTILINKDKVRGLTTAASLWVVACVGIAIGYGYYEIALVSGITVPLILVGLKKLERRITKRSHHANLAITFKDDGDYINNVLECFEECDIHVKEIKHLNYRDGFHKNTVGFMLYCRHFRNWDAFIEEMAEAEYIKDIKRRK
ncbi:MAG: MgtC/SapB family protein [Bacillota bacterium]|nr:MgtC/SapB family protein [Bacillota bacterium]